MLKKSVQNLEQKVSDLEDKIKLVKNQIALQKNTYLEQKILLEQKINLLPSPLGEKIDAKMLTYKPTININLTEKEILEIIK